MGFARIPFYANSKLTLSSPANSSTYTIRILKNDSSTNNSDIKALIFDVGDILFDASLWRRWLAEELASRGKNVTYPKLVASWEALLVDVYKGQADYWETFAKLMQHFDVAAGDVDEMKALAREKGQAVQLERTPMPEVPQTLRQLHELGIVLVALSDTESGEPGVRKILDQLGIEKYFTAVASSFDIGHAKPEPEAFDHAIHATGKTKAQCGFVAHDIDELEGAQKHDLYAIGYNYHRDAPANVFIDNFSELLKLVDGLNS